MKKVDAAGNSAVVTSVTEAHATVAVSAVSIKFKADKVGVSVNAQCVVTKVAAGSQAEKKGVLPGWTIQSVSSKAVSSSKEVTAALAAGRKRKKPFDVTFVPLPSSTSAASGSLPRQPPGDGKEATVGTGADARDDKASATVGAEAAEVGTADGAGAESAASEAEAKATAAAEAAAAEAAAAEAAAAEAAAAEAERKRLEEEEAKRLGNGMVKLYYQMYDEEFEIKDGTITAETIDDTYGLTFVMPKCKIHISDMDPSAQHQADGSFVTAPLLYEEPEGTIHGLRTDTKYWVYVQQDGEQLKQDQMRAKEMFKKEDLEEGKPPLSDSYSGMGVPESCSCIEGNPCVDEYGCKDWHHRYEIATKNGWKGF